MMKNRNIAAILRRDAQFVWNAVIAVVFIGFAGAAVGASVIDLIYATQ